MVRYQSTDKLSVRLLCMLKWTKGHLPWSKDTPDLNDMGKVLGNEYHYELRMKDKIHHLNECMQEITVHPEFDTRIDLEEMLLYPAQNSWFHDPRGLKKYTIEEVLAIQAEYMLSKIRMTRVDWCRAQLDAYTWKPSPHLKAIQ